MMWGDLREEYTVYRAAWTAVQSCVAVLLGTLMLQHLAIAARAAGAVIEVQPSSNLPHGYEQISGSGFDPLATIVLSVVTQAGTTQVGTVTADARGAVIGAITLPLNLDVSTPDSIVAQESGAALTASTGINGFALMPVISAGQSSARGGDTVAIKGLGFAPSDPITVTVGGAPALILPSGSDQVQSAADGTFSVSFTIPFNAATGNGAIVATGSANGIGQQDSASIPFAVLGARALAVWPQAVAAGGSISLTGTGFSAGEPVTITQSYTDTTTGASASFGATGQADAAGQLRQAIQAPQIHGASTMVTVVTTGQVSGTALSASYTVDAAPSLLASPVVATPGSMITVQGTHFSPGERLLMTTRLFPTVEGGVPIDSTGSFTLSEQIRAVLPAGTYSIGVSGAAGDQAVTNVTIPTPPTPHITASTSSIMPGATLEVSGAPFLPGEPVRLSLGTSVITPLQGPAVAAAGGTFSATLRIPTLPSSGSYDLTVSGLQTGATASLPLHLQLPFVDKTYFAEGYTGQGPNVTFGETIGILNTGAITATGRIEYMLGRGITQTVPITLPAHTQMSEDVVHDVGPNQRVSAIVEADHPLVARRSITRTAAGGAALSGSTSYGTPALSPYWYFAEGYTGVTFQPYLAIFNPGSVPASVTMRPAVSGGAPVAPSTVTVAAHGRVSVNLRALFPNRSLGILVQADQPIAVERTLYWGAGAGSAKYGCDVSTGAAAPAATLTFPYATSANNDQTFVALVNLTAADAHAQVTFVGPQGPAGNGSTVRVPPGARTTIMLPSHAINPESVVITSDVPLIGEESQYFGGSPNEGMHSGSVLASSAMPAVNWAFPAMPSTGTPSARWYALNTGMSSADVTVDDLNPDGSIRTSRLPAIGAGRLEAIAGVALRATDTLTWRSSSPLTVVEVLHWSDGQSAVLAGAALTP